MNNPLNIPILITSAINVSAPKTALTNKDERLDLTLRSIEKWLSLEFVNQLIICDGSGFDLSGYINPLMSKHSKTDCEVIFFTNDIAKVREKGKGYGEGEIINYALQHSRILYAAKAFGKCTGKLWVENYLDCVKAFNGLAAFDFKGGVNPSQIDTRFYLVSKDFYKSNLATAYQSVDDKNGFYLEHAFRDGLRVKRVSDYAMFPTPRVCGISGSMGLMYRESWLKNVMRDVRSLIIKLANL